MVGQRIAHYEVLEEIGSGGMGVVYRALDTRLGRDVAIKALPDDFARDPERLARFEREAKTLATLNHLNIGAIYGLEKSHDRQFLILELVDGETLAELIKRGPLPFDEACSIAVQIASGLEAAHEREIVHRDVKPANIKVSSEGQVKILDFGLAGTPVPETASRVDPQLSRSPTLTQQITGAGTLLGTAGYMSPEQVRGKRTDRRADIWAFGCCVYEMFTGQAAFPGETVSDRLARILEREPEWKLLPDRVPTVIRGLLRRCVQKDLNRRLHDIADARIEIEDTLREPRETSEVAATALAARPKWIMAAAVVGIGLLGFILGKIVSDMTRGHGAPEAIAQPTARFAIDLPETLPLEPSLRSALAASPDGQSVVYVARRGDSTELALRRLDDMEVHPIPGTKGASGPFFSPDGEYVGFQVAGKLMKAPLSGGAIPLADVSAFRGGAWNSQGTILFTAVPGTGLWQVPAMGGDSQLVTELDPNNDERTHRWPNFLPGGKHALITVRSGWHSSFEQGRIARLSLSTGTIESVFDGGSDAQYVSSGHLLFVRSGKLFAVPYDPGENRIAGQATAVVDDVMTNPSTGAGHFDVSNNGTLVYVRGGEWVPKRKLVWVAPDEAERPVIASTGAFQSPRLSPDEKRLAVTVEGANDDIWIYDRASGSPMRLTFEAGANVAPTWSPDSSQVTFSSNREGSFNLYRKPADGSRPAERLTTSEHIQFVGSWSSDGLLLAFIQISAETGPDIWVYDDKTKQQEPLLQGVYSESSPAFSPDGRWLAYTSDESGRPEIYAHEFRGGGGKWQISTEGGSEPLWSRDGRTLFYRSGNRLFRVPVEPGAEWVAQKPQVALEVKYEANAISGIPNYDVSPNGKEFVIVRSQPRMLPGRIEVVLNWFEELRRTAR